MEIENQSLNLNGNPPILFVTIGHIMKLTDKGKSTANDYLKAIRTRYHIVKPSKVTIDIVCDYFTISKTQFYHKIYG